MANGTFNPLVSIVIPVYNGANYMREAIDSALAQTYNNIEIIVVNDGSCDGGLTEQIAKGYGEKIKYIYKKNGGVSSALNTGIRNMNGEYFSWLSHDDVYMPDKIEKEIAALSKTENKAMLVCCGYVPIDKNSQLIGKMPNVSSENIKILSWEYMMSRLFENFPIHGCAFLIRKTVFEEVGLFEESLRFYQDGFMWFKIFMAKYSVLSIPDICVQGRVHSQQLTQKGQSVFRVECEKISSVMIPQLIQISSAKNNFLLKYIKYNAKYCNSIVVKNACVLAKESGLLSFKDYCVIKMIYLFGVIRPIIRKIYYTLFRRTA